MMTLEMKMDDVIDELGIKEVADKTDAEFEKRGMLGKRRRHARIGAKADQSELACV